MVVVYLFLSEICVVFLSFSCIVVEFKYFRERWVDGIMDLICIYIVIIKRKL